ncbi:hypothetical protein ABZ867_16780 [Streptomyces cinnamoneus]
MSTREHPPANSLTSTSAKPSSAEPALATDGSGAPKGVAEGVPSSVRPDPRPADGRYIVATLRICAPYGAVPSARSVCACGRDETAYGPRQILALVQRHTDHRTACPLRADDRSAAA